MAMTREALETEKRGYEMRGLTDRVAEVDEQIALLTETPPAGDDEPDNGGVLIDVNSSVNPAASTEEVEEVEEVGSVETASEPKPQPSGRARKS